MAKKLIPTQADALRQQADDLRRQAGMLDGLADELAIAEADEKNRNYFFLLTYTQSEKRITDSWAEGPYRYVTRRVLARTDVEAFAKAAKVIEGMMRRTGADLRFDSEVGIDGEDHLIEKLTKNKAVLDLLM